MDPVSRLLAERTTLRLSSLDRLLVQGYVPRLQSEGLWCAGCSIVATRLRPGYRAGARSDGGGGGLVRGRGRHPLRQLRARPG